MFTVFFISTYKIMLTKVEDEIFSLQLLAESCAELCTRKHMPKCRLFIILICIRKFPVLTVGARDCYATKFHNVH
jgi:hypothetical protein